MKNFGIFAILSILALTAIECQSEENIGVPSTTTDSSIFGDQYSTTQTLPIGNSGQQNTAVNNVTPNNQNILHQPISNLAAVHDRIRNRLHQGRIVGRSLLGLENNQVPSQNVGIFGLRQNSMEHLNSLRNHFHHYHNPGRLLNGNILGLGNRFRQPQHQQQYGSNQGNIPQGNNVYANYPQQSHGQIAQGSLPQGNVNYPQEVYTQQQQQGVSAALPPNNAGAYGSYPQEAYQQNQPQSGFFGLRQIQLPLLNRQLQLPLLNRPLLAFGRQNVPQNNELNQSQQPQLVQ